MYEVYIRGSFHGHFETAGAAMEHVDRQARPFNADWVIKDSFGRTYAKG